MVKRDSTNKVYLAKAIFLALIITIVMIMVFSLLIMFTSLRESKIPLLNNMAMVISVAIASVYVATKIKERGWVQGGLVGVGYCLILILLNFIFIRPFQLDLIFATRVVIATLTGVIGGMIGINLS